MTSIPVPTVLNTTDANEFVNADGSKRNFESDGNFGWILIVFVCWVLIASHD